MYVVCLLFYAIGGFCLFLYFYLFTAFYAVGEVRPGKYFMPEYLFHINTQGQGRLHWPTQL